MLHAFPIRIALNFKIPLVLLGENSAIEYSGSIKKYDAKKLVINGLKNLLLIQI